MADARQGNPPGSSESRGRGRLGGPSHPATTSLPAAVETADSPVSCSSKAKVGRSKFKRACGGYWMRHRETGLLVPARCNSHLCPDCSPLHQMTARLAIEQGLLRRGIKHRDARVVWLTLTDSAKGEMDLRSLRRMWDNTRRRLQRMWGASDYALSLEFQQRGALHPHVCIEVADEVADDLKDHRSRASYRRRMHELRPAMEELGWGQMVDAETIAIGHEQRIGKYAAKSISAYATKEAKELFKAAGAKHVRPVRLSYGWFPGGLAKAREVVLRQERMLPERLGGTWERVAKPRTC